MKLCRVVLILCALVTGAAILPVKAAQPVHEYIRQTPYPQSFHTPYLNPAPLLVPRSMKTGKFVEFELSQDKKFHPDRTIGSGPVRWCVFNPHQILDPGVWYWRFRCLDEAGKAAAWSQSFLFIMDSDTPQFVTPPFSKFMDAMPKGYPRLFCFLEEKLPEARRTMTGHPEYYNMIEVARQGLSANYKTEQQPYNKVTEMATYCDYLHTAYKMTQRAIYANKMVEYVRCLLASTLDRSKLTNDFYAGDLVMLFAYVYDSCQDRLSAEEKQQMEQTIVMILEFYNGKHGGSRRVFDVSENHLYANHFWQFTFRHFMQGAMVLYDKYPQAREYLRYSYELWTSRAPASAFNRDGNWHNGTCYFSANAVTLYYVGCLFSHLTGTDFLQHPWYREVGRSMVYSWPAGSMSAGFGDGNEQMNNKPLRIRSAFADFIGRSLGDPYALWYTTHNTRYLLDYEMRLYRMTHDSRSKDTDFPANSPKALWFKDTGEMIAHSDLGNPERNLFLSFRSSPFGSGSHTLADQNSFNIHYAGAPVYRTSGNYMNFSDPHNLLAYRHTRAHNTILVDGIGQPFSPKAHGNIVRMLGGENISYCLGDASNAYYGISEIPMWVDNFKNRGVEQSRENGFGATPLTLYRRHIFLLHPDKVVIYDELEAKEPVRWDWLLHSPEKFHIDNSSNTLTTHRAKSDLTSQARLFSGQPCVISQTDAYAADPNDKVAERGETLDKQWHMTASFGPSKAVRILTVIQIGSDGKKPQDIIGEGSELCCGPWSIEAELNPDKKAGIRISNQTKNVFFDYGGCDDRRNQEGSSLLQDVIDGQLRTLEATDREPLLTGGSK